MPTVTQDGFVKSFEEFKDGILNLDPVHFIEENLTLDGKPFRINGNGYKPFADIYRYIGIKAIEKESLPVVLVKGRQVGATTMAAALECYFMACGLYGNNGRSPMRIMHLFPTLSLAASYSKDKFAPMISSSKPVPGVMKVNGMLKSFLETKMDNSSPANNSMHFKRFLQGNQVWVESTGKAGDRIRGFTADAGFFDECFPYDQEIITSNGNVKIGILVDLYKNNKKLPKVKTFNEDRNIFEYKEIKNAWNRGERDLFELTCGNLKIKCTGNHRFLTTKGWKCTVDLTNNDIIKTSEPAINHIELTANGLIPVSSVVKLIKSESVYDIEVEDNHNFIVIDGNRGLIAHNCQDIPDKAVGAVTKILAQSKYGLKGEGVQVYFGTPKTKGGGYWKMWQNSTQQYYHLHCEKCGEYFPLYRPDVDWTKIWLYGYIVQCTHCNHEQDKRVAAETGKWIPLGNTESPNYIGFHINQLYIPTFTKEVIEKAMPENSPTNSERIYMNEVLGEFYDGEGGTISFGEIEEKCSDLKRKLTEKITPSENKKVYAGFDWGRRGALDQMAGRRQGKSYSCGVILTPIGPKLFQVEFAMRLLRNDPAYKREVVEEMFRQYSVSLAVGDIGDAGDLTHELQTDLGDKFLASRALAGVNKHITFRNDVFPKEIQFERDYYISELISLLKNGSIKFPWASLDRVKWLVDHCCSMEIKITQDRKGDPIRHYIKGAGPNDGLMALLNAYLAWKFDVTQGFKIQQPGNMNYDVPFNNTSISAIAAYMPGLKI